MKTKLYRIRDKNTGIFLTLGNYRKKTTWLVYPSEAIKENKEFFENSTHEHEVVTFELKEVESKPIKI